LLPYQLFCSKIPNGVNGIALTIINGILFALVALVYSSAGFGGGSMYLAILAQSGQSVSVIRFSGLLCNAVVTAQGLWRSAMFGWFALKPVLGLLMFSVPACLVGASWKLTDQYYYMLLSICLLIAAVLMFFKPTNSQNNQYPVNRFWLYPLSAVIGFVSGITGIGGGVYLAPMLHLSGWGTPKHIAAASSGYILVNSLAGLSVHLANGTAVFSGDLFWLVFCVLLGGFIGSYLSNAILSQKKVRFITAGIILFASLRIIWKYL
jgi:uncharacterized protein